MSNAAVFNESPSQLLVKSTTRRSDYRELLTDKAWLGFVYRYSLDMRRDERVLAGHDFDTKAEIDAAHFQEATTQAE